jgi:hypothetical protein
MHLLTLLKSEKENILSIVKEIEDINIVMSDTTEECFGLLDILPDIDAVIFDDDSLDEVLKNLNEDNVSVDFIYFGNKAVEVELIYFQKVESAIQLISYLKTGLKVTPVLQSDDIQYTKIAASSLNSIIKCPVDFYLRINNGEFYKYIKYFQKESELDHAKVKEQKTKGLTEYFVMTEDLSTFTSYLNTLYKKVLSQKNLKGETLSKNAIAQIFSQLNSIGFTQESCEVAYKTIENMTKSASKNLKSELRDIFKNKNSFKFKKSMMISIIIYSFTPKLKWVTGSIRDSLGLCAFLCDRDLEEDSMSSILSEREVSISEYNERQQKLILNHALKASQWASSFDEFPAELIRLIKQHHGSVSGYGFVKELGPQITLASTLYILIESVCIRILLSSGGKLNATNIIEELKTEYYSNKFHQLADEFLLFLKEEFSKSN